MPAGACILYALSCNLADSDLAGRLDILSRGGKRSSSEDGDADDDGTTASGSEARLKPWNRRRARDLGMPSADGKAPPLIDSIHKLMQLWKTGEQSRVESYLEDRGLIRQELFARVVQALIELSENGIHPLAVETVYQSLSSVPNAQVLVASHSPELLMCAEPKDVLCCSKDEEGATQIIRGDQHPRLAYWRSAADVDLLFASEILG